MNNETVKVEPAKFSISVSPTKTCSYMLLEQVGAPDLRSAHMLPGTRLEGKICTWLEKNWMHNMHIVDRLLSINEVKSDGTTHRIFVRSKFAEAAMRGVVSFLSKHGQDIEALRSILRPTTLAGTPAPQPSNVFNHMSYVERQAHMKANRS